MSLSADPLYRLAGSPTVRRVRVVDPQVREFANTVERVERALHEDEDDEVSRTILRILGRIRWQLHTVPLPPGHPGLGLHGDIAVLQRWAGVLGNMRGEAAGAELSAALQLLETLRASGIRPLGETLLQRLVMTESRRLLLRSQRLSPTVEEWLTEYGIAVQVVASRQGARVPVVDLCCVVGPSRWHPGHLVTAPRAQEIIFIHHSWVRDDDRVQGALASLGGVLFVAISSDDGPESSELLETGFEPEVDWGAISLGVRDHLDREGEAADVPARAVIVAGGLRVFLEEDPDSVLFVVQPGEPTGRRVRRERVLGIGIGDYLLLRTERGRDDIIRLLADGLLKDRVRELRERQETWKAALRAAVQSRGFDRVLADLGRLGMKSRNLRGWLLPDTIRTGTEADFLILMKYCGLGAVAALFWKSMRMLARAHLVAGQRLRDALEREVEGADFDEVARSGRLDVKLRFKGTGTLSILRVEAIAPDVTLVPHGLLRVPEPVSADLWLE